MSSEFLSRSGSVLRLLNIHHLAPKVEKLITKKKHIGDGIFNLSRRYTYYLLLRKGLLVKFPHIVFHMHKQGLTKIVSGKNIREYTILLP